MRTVAAGSLSLALAACTSSAGQAPKPDVALAPSAESTASGPAAPGLVDTEVAFGDGQKLRAPAGWTVSVWARVPGARLLAWAPDGRLLVSRPKSGDVIAVSAAQADGPAVQKTLVSGLNQPHGLAFVGDTLYVAESDQVDTFKYADGAVSGKRVVIDGLPDAKSPELGGAYAHALKSVAIGGDGTI